MMRELVDNLQINYVSKGTQVNSCKTYFYKCLLLILFWLTSNDAFRPLNLWSVTCHFCLRNTLYEDRTRDPSIILGFGTSDVKLFCPDVKKWFSRPSVREFTFECWPIKRRNSSVEFYLLMRRITTTCKDRVKGMVISYK